MSDFICKKCGSTEYEIKDKPNGTGIAHGLYCAKCGFWHKWLGKEELRQYEKKDSKDEIIARLQAENAELRERLGKAVELPVPLGTPVLKVWRNRVPTDDTRMDFVDMWEITTVSFKLEYYTLWGKQYFHNTEEGRKAAEARLEELKGEEKNG